MSNDHSINPSADLVVEALGERGVPVFRTDLAAFPQALTVDAPTARLGGGFSRTIHDEISGSLQSIATRCAPWLACPGHRP